jgi:hypothetical protein
VSELQQLVGEPAICRLSSELLISEQIPAVPVGEVSFCESDIDGAEHRLRIEEKVYNFFY